MVPLTGYADRLSVAPGENIEFKVSSQFTEPYSARLVRVICGDPNPAGPGIKEQEIAANFTGSYPSRQQPVQLGSYAYVSAESMAKLPALQSFSVVATIWPTTPAKCRQSVLSWFDKETMKGFALSIDEQGVHSVVGDGQGESAELSLGKPLRSRVWYRVWLSYDAERGRLTIGQYPLLSALSVDDIGEQTVTLNCKPIENLPQALFIAARKSDENDGIEQAFNGKIEQPLLLEQLLSSAEISALGEDSGSYKSLAQWDFAQDISSNRIIDCGPHQLHGELVNLPTRAMTGSNWDGSEMCWRHAPGQYAAIHFHDDDIYDCGWQTDFSFTVPDDFKSGVYAVRIKCNETEDMIPFFVRPKQGAPQAKLCVIIPSLTYTVYSNYARNVTDNVYRQRVTEWGARPWTVDEHREFGVSTYNNHTDGSGVSYASWLRPWLTQRSGFLAYVDPHGSGLRHFPADTHLLDWLEAKGHDFDVITDHDLHAEGASLLAPYKAVMTMSHPEYQTKQTLDAISIYINQGGRLLYLGGNGFYWKVALNEHYPAAVEIRRGEGGIRAWAAEPGEYYNCFDGQYGGLWRRNGRPPQQLVGVGFTSQGTFEGSYYRRQQGASDARVAWIFDGVDDDIIGNFGLSGGGAAGFELDRVDKRLGTPAHAIVLASSENHKPENFVLVPEELLTDKVTWPGEPIDSLIRADMTYFETANDGAVFSVGSITFCGSLAHNDYDSNISRIIDNVLRRFQA